MDFTFTRIERSDSWLYDISGLKVKTDSFYRQDQNRVLVVGGYSQIKYTFENPEIVRGKRVFEPFAGSGCMGLMALYMGAEHCTFLDINPRSIQFVHENIALNNFDESSYAAIEGDIAEYTPDSKFDVIFANPPFIAVPDGIDGTLHSVGGIDGNYLTDVFLSRLSHLLKPEGQVFLPLFQLEDESGPIVLKSLERYAPDRPKKLIKARPKSIPFEKYADEWKRQLPDDVEIIDKWVSEVRSLHGLRLCVNSYSIHIGAETGSMTPSVITEHGGEVRSEVEWFKGKVSEVINYRVS